jgi:hypothetical protein
MEIYNLSNVRDHWDSELGTQFIKESKFTRELFDDIFELKKIEKESKKIEKKTKKN